MGSGGWRTQNFLRGLGVVEARLPYTQNAGEHNLQPIPFLRVISSMVERQSSKLDTGVRSPDFAPY